MNYISLPIELQAFQFRGFESKEEILKIAPGAIINDANNRVTLDGRTGKLFDYVVLDPMGHPYLCPQEVFELKYKKKVEEMMREEEVVLQARYTNKTKGCSVILTKIMEVHNGLTNQLCVWLNHEDTYKIMTLDEFQNKYTKDNK